MGNTNSLGSILGEVVGRDEASGDTGIKTGETVVGSIYDGVLEATGILQVQVELAVLGVVGGLGAGTNVCLELVETVGNDLYI